MNNTEIERKYLVRSEEFKALATRHYDILQGYLCADGIRTVRIRLKADKGVLTIKGRGNGVSRFEWEKEVSREDALALFPLCHPGRVEKTRYVVPIEGTPLNVEVDVFHGENEGLCFAEIELPSEDYVFALPQWLGKEVTGDPHYYNSYISEHPYSTWAENK